MSGLPWSAASSPPDGSASAFAAVLQRRVTRISQQGAAMPFIEKGAVRICYEEAGSGFPLLVIPGGGLNSTMAGLKAAHTPFDPMDEFKSEYRCITSDLRNANGSQTTGPLEVNRPW